MPSFSNFVTMLAWSALLFNASAMAALLRRQDAAVNTTTIPLRIMSLGASVTFGVGSTTGNSYRKNLLDLVTTNGVSPSVQYVGDKNNGNFDNNAVEATNGFTISQIAGLANTAVPQFLPNLVLMDAGTNNCNGGGLVSDAGAQVTTMINNVFAQSPGVTVILTTVLVNSVAAQDACRVDENNQYTQLVATMQAAGAKLVFVDMRSPAGPLVTDLADGRHPNDGGYVKVANVWFSGIQEVINKGLLVEPVALPTTSRA